jgi:peptide/nickel transport system permease protein
VTRYIVRRIIQAVVVMIGVMTLTFFLIRLSGDPAAYFVDIDLEWDEERVSLELDYARRRLGFDDPLPVQYVKYLWRIVSLDFRESFRYQAPTTEIVLERLPRTIQLGLAQYLFAIFTGLPLGVLAALYRGSIFDTAATTVSVVGFIFPNFWLGILLIILFAVILGWLPSSGYQSWKHYILPTITGGVGGTAVLARYARSGMLEVMGQDYIRTARAKGLSEPSVIVKHAFRNGMITLLSITVPLTTAIIGGSIVIENIFAWPGIGQLFIQSMTVRDYPVIFMLTVLLGSISVIIFLVLDVSYAIADPRIRFGTNAT